MRRLTAAWAGCVGTWEGREEHAAWGSREPLQCVKVGLLFRRFPTSYGLSNAWAAGPN